jgi:glyoxylate reductase
MAGRKKPLVVITRKLPDPVETRMRELFDARLNIDDRAMTQPELVAAMREADVLVPTITDRIDAALIEQAGPNLKLIAKFGNGVDTHRSSHAAWAKKGLTVTNTPSVLTEDTADMATALMLDPAAAGSIEGAQMLAARPTANGPAGRPPPCSAAASARQARSASSAWAASAPPSPGAPGPSASPIHYFSTATAVAPAIEGPAWRPPTGQSLDQMLARMDIISVNCPSTPATFHLLSARRLALMQPTAYIVNTARGDIIDEAALIQMVQEGRLAGAGLDVFEHEPAINPKLVRLAQQDKIVLLPHMGSATIEGRIDMGDKVIINIKVWADGHRPPDRVLPGRV